MQKLISVGILFASSLIVAAQGPKPAVGKTASPAPESFAVEKALANMVLAAHGGPKLKAMKSFMIRGTVDIATSAITQTIPATFITVFAGDRYRIELNNPFQPFKQVYDGVNTTSSIRGGLTLPPINRLGFPLLPRIGDAGFFYYLAAREKEDHRAGGTAAQGAAIARYAWRRLPTCVTRPRHSRRRQSSG